jgi:hypothetical protein
MIQSYRKKYEDDEIYYTHLQNLLNNYVKVLNIEERYDKHVLT